MRAALPNVDAVAVATSLPQLVLGRLSLEELDLRVSVRVFWHVQRDRMKIALLPETTPELNVALKHFRVLCCCVPPALVRTLAPVVLTKLSGRYFDVDLASQEENDATEVEADSSDDEEAER